MEILTIVLRCLGIWAVAAILIFFFLIWPLCKISASADELSRRMQVASGRSDDAAGRD